VDGWIDPQEDLLAVAHRISCRASRRSRWERPAARRRAPP
jgi:hypothetical protein